MVKVGQFRQYLSLIQIMNIHAFYLTRLVEFMYGKMVTKISMVTLKGT